MPDINEIIDELSEQITASLPDEAVHKIAELSRLEGDHNAEIAAVLAEHNIDVNTILEAKEEELKNV